MTFVSISWMSTIAAASYRSAVSSKATVSFEGPSPAGVEARGGLVDVETTFCCVVLESTRLMNTFVDGSYLILLILVYSFNTGESVSYPYLISTQYLRLSK